ncbi:PH domain-containing protein [Arcicella rigui]|uniref:PH domain-containing protein n=1 Tax=Arcicella rigui TaxID=797020 RepID=A0ABU5QD15_9BACT|nr:PH domain-containing protein [Arcicella rigui]MEA5140503.1 PH domain-containing protein [Arcicella rigui]
MKKFQSNIKKSNFGAIIVLILIALGFSLYSMYVHKIDFIDAFVDVILNKPTKWVFIFQFLFYTISLYDTYLIRENSIVIKFGGFITLKKLEINNITKIFERKQYLIIETSTSKYPTSLSPKDKLGFVQSLKELNANIEIDSKILVQTAIQPAV